jgi:hypothetical protein
MPISTGSMPASDPFSANRRPCVELLDEAIVEVLRRKTSAERVAMVFDAERTMRLLLEAHLRWQHPDWDAEQVAREIAWRRNRESV